MKKLFTFKICLVLLLFSAAKSFAQETIMNDIDYPFLNKLIASAKENYALAKIRQEQVNIAQTTYKASKFAWFDALSVSYIYNPSNTINYVQSTTATTGTNNTLTPGLFQNFQAAFTLNVGTLWRNPSNTKNAKSNYNIALEEQEAYNGNLQTQVTTLYLTYLQQMALLRLRTKTSQDVATTFSLIKRQFEKNNETIDNFTKASTAFSESNALKIDAETGTLKAKFALEELVGKRLEEIK